ncbi:dihydrofolate reductase [Neisseriaceae bacterium ESL0693]|nr:dihydrofolate reductase [Neisseriaceae bacterium ESL0693]
MPQKITLIAALSQNHCIGQANTMPWHIPEDFAFFKQYTLNKPVIMGRKTWESLPIKPLPQRRNIVISRHNQKSVDQAECADTLHMALAMCTGDEEIIIMGGGQIYTQALPLATDLRLTEVQLCIHGDTFFPAWSTDEWLETERTHHVSKKNDIAFDFVHWQRQYRKPTTVTVR